MTPPFKQATAMYNATGAGSPLCATARADGSSVVIEVGEIFKREKGKDRHSLDLKLK